MDMRDIGFGVCIVLLLIVFGAVIFSGKEDYKTHKRLMAQCMSDGNKEYECHYLLKPNQNNTTVIPMPVVIGR